MSVLPEKVRIDPAPAAKTRVRRAKTAGPKIAGGGDESRRIAAAILEVLGGARLPSEAATSLGVSQARYYALESRALSGFVEACEPRPKGRQRRPESQVAHLERDLERVRRENARLSALVRVARRAAGLSEAPEKKREPGGKPRRRRKATARALRAVAVLRAPAPQDGSPSPVTSQDA